MFKKLAVTSLAGVILLTGCDQGIKDIKPLTLEEVAGKRIAQMSTDEKEGLIYKFVSDRITVNRDNLIDIDSRDMSKINTLITNISANLKGTKKDILKEEYANYLLLEFAKTPYEWQQTKVDPVGFDAAARLYFVDVTYTTTGNFKRVVPISKIPNGSPDEETLKQKRYSDYLAYLSFKQRGNMEEAQKSLNQFQTAWGSVESIKQEQQGVSLLDRTKLEQQDSEGIGKLTYSGVVQDSKFNGGAEMTFRYVFKYKYNLGEETDLEVESLYLKDYTLKDSDSIVNSLKRDNTNGIEVLKPFIDKLIISYHKAMQEANDQGLNSLFLTYGDVDKYYDDLSKYTYNTIGGYNFEILQRGGTNVVVKVDRINQLRAKGAEMSLPTYEEEWVYNLVLDKDDKIKIRNANMVKSTLIGEPISVIKNVNGVSDMIQYSGESFTTTNKEKVEEALKKFSKVVFNGKVDSSEFTNIVDVGVSDVTLKKISDVVTSVQDADRKITYIVSYDTKTNVYVSVTLREVFEKGNQSLDTESVVDLVNRNGEWKVVNYVRTLSVKTSTVQMNTKNALSEDKK